MNKELLYSFNDTLEIFFSRTDWSRETKQRKKKNNYTKLLQSFDVFLKYFTIDNLPSPFLTQRGLVYFMNDLILRECYPDTVLLTAFFQTIKIPTVIKSNLSTENRKSYEDVLSRYLTTFFAQNTKNNYPLQTKQIPQKGKHKYHTT